MSRKPRSRRELQAAFAARLAVQPAPRSPLAAFAAQPVVMHSCLQGHDHLTAGLAANCDVLMRATFVAVEAS